ncbi:MAG: Gfo/Idh/MocA family oxidoreductase [Candidatus Latescibacterota bacterium]|nr:Gfo/Idh/MocA family oxidoreductase [Candidatus Latescibacterota bacterium]
MAKRVRVGVIGLGWPGREHISGYLQSSRVEVTAVCDMNVELAEQVAEERGIFGLYSDHRKMLREADVDAVSVCLPNYLHAPVSLDALRAGKHVLCEKPPALNSRQARKLADTAGGAGLTLMYALCQRFSGPTAAAKRYIERGELGDIYFARAIYHRRRGIPPGTRSWFVDKKRSGGGALIDIGVHALDQAWWLMGTPQPVTVSGSAYRHFGHVLPKGVNFDVDDSTFALVRFENEATLILECSWALNLPGGSGIHLAGTRGGAELSPLKIYVERHGVQEDLIPEVPAVDAFAGQTDHFARCIQTGKTPLISAEQGVQLMQILDGIYKSAETGKEVRLS